ncbi:MAG: S8 family serine peptidase [Hyphomonadaceae bacterium]
MKSRWLILLAALGFALALSGQALAKPPEEEAIDRAEKAAERAAKASERAAEAAERASEREKKDSRDKDIRDSGKVSGNDSDNDSDNKVELASLKPSDGTPTNATADSDDADSNTSGSTESGSGSGDSGGSSGGSSGSDELLSGSNSGSSGGSGDDSSGSNSGSGGSGSGDDDDDDDDGDDGNSKGSGRDQKFGIIPVENDESGNPFREGELVVMSDDAGLVSRAQSLGFGIIEQRPLESIGAVVARLRRPEGVTSNQALELLRTREPTSAAGYNYLYRATGKVPAVPDDRQQATPAPTEAPAHEKNRTTSIGVIDGFAADAINGWKVERLIGTPAMAGHGDAVAGIVLRDLANAYSAEPDRLLLLDVMRGEAGKGAADVAALVVAFDRLVTSHVGIVNLSLAGPDHPALQRAVSQSQKSGMIVVAAVGNDGPAAPPAFPAAYDGVVGVSAVDSSGKPYIYSGRGPHVDIAALGFEVSPTAKGGELVGTSYAAPHVTAMIAGEQKHHSGRSIDSLLTEFAEDAGVPGRDPVYGLGILTLDKPARLAQAAQRSNN